MNVRVQADAFEFVQNTTEEFDVIWMDLFYQEGIPYFTKTKEFVSILLKRLSMNGILIGNTWDSSKGKINEILQLYRTHFTFFAKA